MRGGTGGEGGGEGRKGRERREERKQNTLWKGEGRFGRGSERGGECVRRYVGRYILIFSVLCIAPYKYTCTVCLCHDFSSWKTVCLVESNLCWFSVGFVAMCCVLRC